MDRKEIVKTLRLSPFWADWDYLPHDDRRELVEEIVQISSGVSAMSVNEAIRYGSMADYL